MFDAEPLPICTVPKHREVRPARLEPTGRRQPGRSFHVGSSSARAGTVRAHGNLKARAHLARRHLGDIPGRCGCTRSPVCPLLTTSLGLAAAVLRFGNRPCSPDSRREQQGGSQLFMLFSFDGGPQARGRSINTGRRARRRPGRSRFHGPTRMKRTPLLRSPDSLHDAVRHRGRICPTGCATWRVTPCSLLGQGADGLQFGGADGGELLPGGADSSSGRTAARPTPSPGCNASAQHDSSASAPCAQRPAADPAVETESSYAHGRTQMPGFLWRKICIFGGFVDFS